MRTLLGLLILAAFVVFVEHYVGWTALLAPWSRQPLEAIAAALALSFVSYGLRALRLYDYFRVEMRAAFGPCLRVMLQHNLLNNLLPMRTGELSFPVLMAQTFQVPVVQSVAALFWFRLLDLHTLGALALLAVGTDWLGGPAVAALGSVWLSLPWLLFRANGWLETRINALSASSRWQPLALRAVQSLPQTPAAFWHAWAWTVVNWLVKLAVFAFVLQLFLDMSAAAAWAGAIAGDLTSILPIHGIAGAGTYEAGVVAALLPFGISAEAALPAAVNLHLFLLASTLIGGLVSLALPARRAHG